VEEKEGKRKGSGDELGEGEGVRMEVERMMGVMEGEGEGRKGEEGGREEEGGGGEGEKGTA